MNLIRTMGRGLLTVLWFLSGGMLGAAIAAIIIWWADGCLFSEEPMLNAGDAFGAAAQCGLGLLGAPYGFIAGVLCAAYLRVRWSSRASLTSAR
jgi:hypothetical protein